MYTPLYTQRFQALPEETQKQIQKTFPRRETVQSETVDSWTKFTDVIKQAKELAQKWDKLLDDVTLDHTAEDDYGCPRSRVTLEVKGLETDEQYYQRILQQWEWNQQAEERERKEFERLKSKFGQ